MRALPFILCGLAFACEVSAQEQQAERAAPTLEVAFSDETAQLRYRSDTDFMEQANSEVLYTVFLSEDRDVVGSAGLLIDTDIEIGSFAITIGPQAYAGLLSEENNDIFALAFGLGARYELDRKRGLAVVGSAFYSPDVLTFGSADNLSDYMAAAELRINERLTVMGGYRWFELDLVERQERNLQNEVFAGVRWQLR